MNLVYIFILSFIPFIVYSKQFSNLIWFGDELDLLLQVKRSSVLHWAFTTFAENFVPLFKLLWIELAFFSQGEYWWMLLALWTTHAANAALLFFLLNKYGLETIPTAFSVLLFSLTYSVAESLCWTVQLSAVLTSFFMLLGFNLMPSSITSYRLIPIFFCAVCSTLSFSRGILTCLVFAIYIFLLENPLKLTLKKSITSSVFLIPAILTSLLIAKNATGNHHQLSSLSLDIYSQMISFGYYAFSLNPLAMLFRFIEPPDYVWIFCMIKVILIALGFWLSIKHNSQLIKFLFILAIFDAANCVLMGIGRYHTGVKFSMSSRYQYESLVVLMPFLAVTINELWKKIHSVEYKYFTLAVMTGCLISVFLPWRNVMQDWGVSRGTEGQDVLLKGENKPWWGVPTTITVAEAREVVGWLRKQ